MNKLQFKKIAGGQEFMFMVDHNSEKGLGVTAFATKADLESALEEGRVNKNYSKSTAELTLPSGAKVLMKKGSLNLCQGVDAQVANGEGHRLLQMN